MSTLMFIYIKFFNSILETFNFYTDSLYIFGIQGVPKNAPMFELAIIPAKMAPEIKVR